MLDLSKLNVELYDIKLLDGTVLALNRPTQAMMEYVVDMKHIAEEADQAEVIKCITKLFTMILNRNTNGKKFTAEDIENDYDYSIITYVVQDYFTF